MLQSKYDFGIMLASVHRIDQHYYYWKIVENDRYGSKVSERLIRMELQATIKVHAISSLCYVVVVSTGLFTTSIVTLWP